MVDDVRTLVLRLGDQIDHNGEWYPSCEAIEDYLADVLTAVRQEERERCAKIMDAIAHEEQAETGDRFGLEETMKDYAEGDGRLAMLAMHIAQRGAAAIRRGEG